MTNEHSTLDRAAIRVFDEAEHGYADSDGVAIHWAALGEGPPVLFLHGFPDYWGSWYRQMHVLADRWRTVAMDLRGYNLSDRPAGMEQYSMRHVVRDVAAVLDAHASEPAIVVGHDWGGMAAWATAMSRPDLVRLLAIVNLPHPQGLASALATDPVQRRNSAYARRFQRDPPPDGLTPERLLEYLPPQAEPEYYLEALDRSDLSAMLNYYKANYPAAPYLAPTKSPPAVACPVLMMHGLEDMALQATALNDTWRWLDAEFTLVTIPGAGHWVHHEQPDRINQILSDWLVRHSGDSLA